MHSGRQTHLIDCEKKKNIFVNAGREYVFCGKILYLLLENVLNNCSALKHQHCLVYIAISVQVDL